MLLGLLLLMLISLNIGALLSLGAQVGQGQWLSALGTVLFGVLLNGLGFWLLRNLRER